MRKPKASIKCEFCGGVALFTESVKLERDYKRYDYYKCKECGQVSIRVHDTLPKRLLFCLVLLLSISPVSITAYPKVSMAELGKDREVRITTRIERSEQNRYLSVVWADESGELGRSERSLDGDNSEAMFVQYLKVRAGNFVVVATLFRREGDKIIQFSARDTFKVIGGGQ